MRNRREASLRWARLPPMKDPDWTSYPCKRCGKPIYRYTARPRPGRPQVFCSPRCAAETRAEIELQCRVDEYLEDHGELPATCGICGKPILTPGREYCGRNCVASARFATERERS